MAGLIYAPFTLTVSPCPPPGPASRTWQRRLHASPGLKNYGNAPIGGGAAGAAAALPYAERARFRFPFLDAPRCPMIGRARRRLGRGGGAVDRQGVYARAFYKAASVRLRALVCADCGG